MRLPPGCYQRIKTYANGDKVRLTIASNGRIIDAKPVANRIKHTRISKRLARRRRRIGR